MANTSVFGDDDEEFDIDVEGSDTGVPSAPVKKASVSSPVASVQSSAKVQKPTPRGGGASNPLRNRSVIKPEIPTERKSPEAPKATPVRPSPSVRPAAPAPSNLSAPKPSTPTPPVRPALNNTHKETRNVEEKSTQAVPSAPVSFSPAPVEQPVPAPSTVETHSVVESEPVASFEPQVVETPVYSPPAPSRAVEEPNPVNLPTPSVEDDTDEEEVEEVTSRRAPKPSKSNGKSQGKKPSQKDSSKRSMFSRPPKKEPKQSPYGGGRGLAIAMRWVVFSLLGIIALAGFQSIFFPPQFPTREQIIGAVEEKLGVTEFPTAEGQGYVLGFTKTYLTVSADNSAQREAELSQYVSSNILATFQTSTSVDSPVQEVVSGPLVSGVKSVDNQNAIYTVAAQLNDSRWIYLDIPVFYDATTDAFAISGSPSFVPAPPQAQYTSSSTEQPSIDDEASQEARDDMERYLTAWAQSDDGLGALLVAGATPSARYGLAGSVSFANLDSLEVYQPAPNTNDKERKAQVIVRWANPLSIDTTFAQVYDLDIVLQENDNWFVKDIRGGVASSENGNVPSDDSNNIVPSSAPNNATNSSQLGNTGINSTPEPSASEVVAGE